MANIQPKPPTNPAEPPNSENNNGVPVDETDAGGVKTPTNIEDLDDDIQTEINRRLRQARLAGEADGKKKAKSEIETERSKKRLKNLEDDEDFETLYKEEKAIREQAEKRAEQVERDALALEVALEKKLPNPQLLYKRLVGNTREEMEEDAKSLLKVLKSESAPKDVKTPEDPNPPATSEGGDDQVPVAKTVEESDAKYAAQKFLSTYNF